MLRKFNMRAKNSAKNSAKSEASNKCYTDIILLIYYFINHAIATDDVLVFAWEFPFSASRKENTLFDSFVCGEDINPFISNDFFLLEPSDILDDCYT